MASAMCPACKIILVEANSNTYSNLAAAEQTAMNLGANVISNSYGGGESGTLSYEASYSPKSSGVTITVSSGDSGYGVEFPASSPHVTAVGGTSLVRAINTRGWTETVWSGAGSGCSAVYAQPDWQNGLSAACGSGRIVADTSAVADPNTGVAVYAPKNSTSSAWMVFGGTSVGAPLIAGVYAVGKSTTWPTNNAQSLYLNCSSGASCLDINDVVSGSNGSCGNNLCTATDGYDGPSGLGTPERIKAFH